MKNFINFDDFDREFVEDTIKIGIEEKNKLNSNKVEINFGKKFGVLLFEKPSLITKLSFIKALNYNGINEIYFSPDEVGLGKREKVSDVAKVISRMSDIAILRTYEHSTIEEFAKYSTIPVINALSDMEHPCQALSDLLTITEKIGENLSGLNFTFVGDGNNVATSLAKAIVMFGGNYTHLCPKGYEIPKKDLENINSLSKKYNGSFKIENDMNLSITKSDIIYTDVWASMGQEDQEVQRKIDFKKYQLGPGHIEKNNAFFMHDLPAHHGDEITENLVDHPNSIVFEQSENRIWGQLGIIKKMVE